jgi:hypothetical protein
MAYDNGFDFQGLPGKAGGPLFGWSLQQQRENPAKTRTIEEEKEQAKREKDRRERLEEGESEGAPENEPRQ